MHELDAILSEWNNGASSGVLATVVHVKGSAYRRPGARMLILNEGRRVGSISGGCLEGEISRKAWWYTEGGRPVVRVYDTTSDDDAVWEFGLGCNGVVQVMLERTDAARPLLEFLASHRSQGSPAVVATVIRSADPALVGERLFFDEGWTRGGGLVGTPLEAAILPHACSALRESKSRLAHVAGAEVFVEWVGPPPQLVIFGAGHDAIPLVSTASQLGWRVTVADGRPAYTTQDRFPQAEKVVLIGGNDLLSGITITPQTAVVMMTHNYPLDERLLPGILLQRPRYLGMLGPKSRTEKLFQGKRMPPSVHGPVGLDLGGDTPESIALSIASEIQSMLNGRNGGMLKNREGSIHSPAAEVGTPSIEVESERPSYCETHVR